jgi:hypothetical protein
MTSITASYVDYPRGLNVRMSTGFMLLRRAFCSFSVATAARVDTKINGLSYNRVRHSESRNNAH